jgi:transposase InsO family protein
MRCGSLDIRSIEKHQIPEVKGPFYVISVMDNFSRAILASDIYQAQDLASVLIVLYAALEQYGCPQRLVTDNGSVFRAKQAMAIYEALDIHKEWIHRGFVEDYNQQPHLGHRYRDDHRHSPAEVLVWVTGKMRTPEQLHRIFYATRFLRSLDRFGYARFRRWKLYAEEGLARRQTVLWLYGDTLTLE